MVESTAAGLAGRGGMFTSHSLAQTNLSGLVDNCGTLELQRFAEQLRDSRQGGYVYLPYSYVASETYNFCGMYAIKGTHHLSRP